MIKKEVLIEETRSFLKRPLLFEHSLAVAQMAEQLADDCLNQRLNIRHSSKEANKKFTDGSVSKSQAFVGGLLHDIGGVYPSYQRISQAEKWGLKLLPQEKEFPLIIHQKLSKYLAREYFEVNDEQVLAAIECHTTLRKNFSDLDLIIFLADKIRWDGGDDAPFKEGLLTELSVSLESAALYYIDFILAEGLKVAHPWLLEARKDLRRHLQS